MPSGTPPRLSISFVVIAGLPILDLTFGIVFGNPITFLDFADELIAFARDFVEVIVSKFAPLLLDFAFSLLPVSFDTIPIHRIDLLCDKIRFGPACKTSARKRVITI